MKNVGWTVLFVLLFCGVAFAEQASGKGSLGDTLLAGGWGGGLWKGILLGILRAVVGYWSKKPDDPNEKWDWGKFGAAGIVGGLAGAVAGASGMSYDTLTGWAALFGITEAIYRMIQGAWRRFGSKVSAEVVAKAMELTRKP